LLAAACRLKVCATDLRAGAALICAALRADGETEVTGLHHVDRGYVNITGKLAALGADIYRIESAAEIASEAAESNHGTVVNLSSKSARETVSGAVAIASDGEATASYIREKEIPVLKIQPTWA
jgi:UDP-N-acetylglucosamine 1-carboxyvinyltransferase